MKPITKVLDDRDKVLFEKALKFFFFARQHDVKRLDPQLKERIKYSGSVAYSLIITLVKKGNIQIEYMDFLNQELKLLLSLDPKLLTSLQIKPSEIDEIELQEQLEIQFFDEDDQERMKLVYTKESANITLDRAQS